MQRRTALGAPVGAALLLASRTAPAAAVDWCDVDPAVVIKTPEGNREVVYVTVGVLGREYKQAAQTAKVDHVATPSQFRGRTVGTMVHLTVFVSHDRYPSAFPTRATVSSRPKGEGHVYGYTEGRSGSAMVLQFTLATP